MSTIEGLKSRAHSPDTQIKTNRTTGISGIINNAECNTSRSKNKKKSVDNSTKKTSIAKYGDIKFDDMPEWDDERYSGIGIKRLKGYKCVLPIDSLNQLREEFWNSKIKESFIWRNIKQACIMDESTLEYLF